MLRTSTALRCFLLCGATLATFATLATDLQAQRGGRGAREAEGPALDNFTFKSGTCKSDTMQGGEAGYYILLPKGYDADANKDKVYPWILWLPGFGGPNDFLERGGAEVLDRLRGEDKIPEMALVVFKSRRSIYMNGERSGKTEDFLTGDLLTDLQKTYRLSDKREQRALMGVSAGGLGALKIALRHPKIWGAVAVHSAAILPADPEDLSGMYEGLVNRMLRNGLDAELGDPIDKEKWAAHMPLGIVAMKKPADLDGLQIYFAAGTEDNYNFFPANKELDEAMTAKGFKHLFHAVEEGGHAWSSSKMREGVATSLEFVAAAMAGKDAVALTKATLEKAAKKGAKEDGADKEAKDK